MTDILAYKLNSQEEDLIHQFPLTINCNSPLIRNPWLLLLWSFSAECQLQIKEI